MPSYLLMVCGNLGELMNLGRRRFITQFATTAVGRCLLGPAAASLATGQAWAQQESKPKFASFITPLGRGRNWLPETGALGSFPADSKPLETHSNDLIIVKRNNSVLKHFVNFGAHRAGYPAATTGNIDFYGANPSFAKGYSIDQYLIENWGGGAQSLQLGVLPVGNNKSIISWGKTGQRLAPAGNARRVYESLFGSLVGEVAEQEAIRLRQQSILDQWTREISQLNADLSSVHRQVLDQHLTQIEEVEKRLNESEALTCSSSLNITNADDFYTQNDNFPEIGKQMMDMIVLAFSCGQHQAASLAWSYSGSNVVPRWALGARASSHHSITHAANADEAWENISKIEIWYAEQFAYLVNKLSQTMDSQGERLLDSTILYWTSEVGSARSHEGKDVVATIAGNYKNRLRTGYLLDNNNNPLNNVLASIATALDVPTDKFGEQDFATGRYNDMLN